jgi:putative membrane protein
LNIYGAGWLATFFSVLVWSAWNPHDYPTWWLEVFPALIAFIVLVLTRHTFPLTPMVYFLILLHSIILMVGGITPTQKCRLETGGGI